MKKCTFFFMIILTIMLSIGFRYDSKKPSITSVNNIYLYDTLLLVSDSLNGLLIYSLADETSPRFKARIPLKSNQGVAMKDSIIYANSWGGILALRIVNDTNYEVTSVIKVDPYHSNMFNDYSDSYYGGFGCCSGLSSDPINISGGGGMGGSYAIFAVIDSFLYYINNQSIITMDISDAAKPKKLSETFVNWSIETLFPTKDYLFIGGSSGMYVMDRHNPSNPTQIGSIVHFQARDPVVVKDTMAYVTLRNGFSSGILGDELMVVNIASITNPKLIKEILIPTPYGLAIKDTMLYVAQGYNGWILFSLSNPHNPVTLQQWPTPNVKDFIWLNNRLYMMCFDQVKIYSVADPHNPVLVSEIN